MVSSDYNKKPKDATPKGVLDGWAWDPVKDDYVLQTPLPDEAQEAIDDAGGMPERVLSEEEFSRVYSSENFRSNVARLLRLGGSLAKIKSMGVDKNDVSFAKAMEVAYQRLVNGPNAVLLKFMSNKDLVDFLIVSAWAGPYFKAVSTEITEKKKAKTMAQASNSFKAEKSKSNRKQKPEPKPARDNVGGGAILGES